jgi:hypothetical protein
MFSVEQRDRISAWLIERARGDDRVVAAAVIGAAVRGTLDRWSDIDLTFALADGVDVRGVLDDWTTAFATDHSAVFLFDLPVLSTVYRVFLAPGNLQVDVSFTPRVDFGPRIPQFHVLFGETAQPPPLPPAPTPAHRVGLAMHHAVRARACIERGRNWQAEHWISAVRDEVLTLACHRLGLETNYARGFDKLPAAFLRDMESAIVRSVQRDELLRALRAVIEHLLSEAAHVDDAPQVDHAQLRQLGDSV